MGNLKLKKLDKEIVIDLTGPFGQPFYLPNQLQPSKEVSSKYANDILSDWELTINHTEELIELLFLRKKGLSKSLLTGKVRLQGFSEQWKERKLEDFFEERNEVGYNNLQLLSVGKEGVYPQDTSIKKDTSNNDKSKYKRICSGDIGYNTMRMWQGRSALSSMEGIVSPAYTVVKPKPNVNAVYFSHLFKLNETIHKFYRNSQGMVSDTWMCKFKDFATVKVFAPVNIQEQISIANILELSDNEIMQYEAYLSNIKIQKTNLENQLVNVNKA